MLAFYLSLLETDEDKAKFELVYEEYRATMKIIARKYLKEQFIEDALNDAFLRIINNIKGIDEVHSKKTAYFVALLTKHAAIDVLRGEFRNNHVELEQAENYPAVRGGNIFESLDCKMVLEQYKNLPETHRDIIGLRIIAGYSYSQLAEHYGISNIAARKRVQRAREALNELLKG